MGLNQSNIPKTYFILIFTLSTRSLYSYVLFRGLRYITSYCFYYSFNYVNAILFQMYFPTIFLSSIKKASPLSHVSLSFRVLSIYVSDYQRITICHLHSPDVKIDELTVQDVGFHGNVGYSEGTDTSLRGGRHQELVPLKRIGTGEDDELPSSASPVYDAVGVDVNEHVGVGDDVATTPTAGGWIPR